CATVLARRCRCHQGRTRIRFRRIPFGVRHRAGRGDAVRAAVTTEDHGFQIAEVTDPTPGPEELVIRVAACGVCGSAIKGQPFMPAGMVRGHELGGEIVAVGSEAGNWHEGATVAVLPVVSCGSCRYCTDGRVSHCAQTRYIGMGPDPGGFAEMAVAPA